MSPFEPKNRIRWEPSETALPMRKTMRGSGCVTLLIVVPGAALAGLIAGIVRITLITSGQGHPAAPDKFWVFSVVSFAISGGLMALFFGLNRLLVKTTVGINRDFVTYTGRGPLGQRRWKEPLRNYQGVVKEFTYFAASPSVTYYHVVLKHRDRGKDVDLFKAKGVGSIELWEQSWHQFGQLLELPLLEKTAAGLQPAGLGSLRKLALEYRSRSASAAALKLGRKAVVEPTPNGVHITHPHYWGCWRGLLGVAFSAVFLRVGFLFQRGGAGGIWVFLVVMGLFLLIGLGSFLGDLFTSEELLIQSNKVEYWQRYGKRVKAHKVIDLADVKQVAVKKDPENAGLASYLWLESEDEVVNFGGLLSRRNKVALRDFILARLSRCLPAKPGSWPGHLRPRR